MVGRTTLVMGVAVACALAVACGGVVVAQDGTGDDANTTAGNGTANASADAPPDPESDVLGWEDGVWHDEAIDVNQSDGLTEAERELLVARTKARVEEIRGLEFTGNVSVEVVARESLSGAGTGNDSAAEDGNRSADTPEPRRHADDQTVYLNQLLESLFLVNETTDAGQVLARGQTESTAAYYVAAGNELVVVGDPDRPTIDEGLLAHELVHALQDQHLDGDTWFVGLATIDEYLAYLGLSEGDAEYVRAVYEHRCGATWSCTDAPETASGGNASAVDVGVFRYTFQPYADGAAFVADLRERGGWEAVNDAYGSPPATTAQVIHPGSYDGEAPPAVDVPGPDSESDWRVVGTDRLGEAGVYAMFHAQASERGVPVLDPRSHHEPEAGPLDTLNYTAAPSAGWVNGSLVVARNGSDEGYAWTTRWETPAEAREFADAYRQILRSYDAERPADGVWVVADGGFADAFRVERDGRSVTITNAPDVADLDAVNPAGNATATASSGNESAA